jgi:hypothetical protein
MLAFNMMVPPKVRANMGGRTLSQWYPGKNAAVPQADGPDF